MPDETRQAVHSALQSAPAASTVPPLVLDVYRREANALLVPGLARDDALQRVSRRMALEIVDSTQRSPVVVYQITHSIKYDYLKMYFDGDKFARWSLSTINGAAAV